MMAGKHLKKERKKAGKDVVRDLTWNCGRGQLNSCDLMEQLAFFSHLHLGKSPEKTLGKGRGELEIPWTVIGQTAVQLRSHAAAGG